MATFTFGNSTNDYVEVIDETYVDPLGAGRVRMVRPAAGFAVKVKNFATDADLADGVTVADGQLAVYTTTDIPKIKVSGDNWVTWRWLIAQEAAGGNSTVTVTQITATGTADGTTFLRGDGAWATPPGGSTTSASITDATTVGKAVLTATDAAAARTATGALAASAVSTFAATFLDDTSAAAVRTTIGALGSSDVTGYATKVGGLTQFTDVSSTAPAGGQAPIFDADAGQYVPTDLSTLYAAIGPDGRIVTTAEPRWYVPTVIVDEGSPPPASFPAGGLVLARPAAASLVPTVAGSASSQGVTSIAVTTTQDFAAGDVMGVFIGASGEVTLPTTYTITFSAGAGTVNSVVEAHQSGSAQSDIKYVRVGTAIPSGSTVTITANQNRVIALAVLAKMPNLVSSGALDASAGTSGSGTSPLAISIGPTAATVQANELAVAAVVQNSGTGTVSRTVAGTNGWGALGSVALTTTSGGSARALWVVYKILTAAAPVTATLQVTSSDGSQGAWAGTVATFRAA